MESSNQPHHQNCCRCKGLDDSSLINLKHILTERQRLCDLRGSSSTTQTNEMSSETALKVVLFSDCVMATRTQEPLPKKRPLGTASVFSQKVYFPQKCFLIAEM